VRVDLHNFTTGGVTVLNLASVDADLVAFYGGFTDGRHAFVFGTGYSAGENGKVARIDLANFTAGGVTVLDLATVNPR
jgi:hypothetical protein